MITLNQIVNTMHNYAIGIQIALSLISKLKMSKKTLQMMLKKRFDTSNYETHRSLPKGKNKNVIGLIKDELAGKITT